MKVGILTFHNAHNYGAVLQCFALQHYLQHIGYTVEIIDYRPEFYREQYRPHTLVSCLRKNPWAMLRNIFYHYYLFNKRCKSFDDFINKHLCLSKEVSESKIPHCYQAYIVGSDQIWNPAITNGFKDVYFCNFHFDKGRSKYIAYAPSMELNNPSFEEASFLKANLRRMDALSVREESLIPMLESLSNKKVELVCDPTFLLDATQWKGFIKERLLHKPYVVLYQVRDNPAVFDFASKIASQIKGKVVCLTARIDGKYPIDYQTAPPLNFINYIAYADYVVTTSFHGTAFSLIFNVPFYTFLLGDNFDSRSSSLLKKVGLEDRLVFPGNKVKIEPVDFTLCNAKIKELISNSKKYLERALNI